MDMVYGCVYTLTITESICAHLYAEHDDLKFQEQIMPLLYTVLIIKV